MRLNENVWLVILAAAAVLITVTAGLASRQEAAQASAFAARASHARPQKTVASDSVAVPTTQTPAPTPAPAVTPNATTTTTITTVSATTTTAKSTAKKTTAKVAPRKSTSTTSTVTARAAAVGDLVQIGSFQGETLSWRILSIDAKRIVLLSDEVLEAGAYQSDENVTDANDYTSSSVRGWLNTTFVPAAFGANAATDARLGRSSASDAVAGDIAYLITKSQLERYLPEADDRIASSSAWAQAHNGYDDLPLSAGPVYWWLADEPGTAATNVAPVVQANGAVNGQRYTAIGSDGVRPAIKLVAASVKLTPVAGSTGVYAAVAK